MRHILSTALVALIVGSLAGVTVSTLAQEPAQTPDEGVVTAGLNADSVDGRHAVKATSKKSQRRSKLVAADAKGYLPSNIVKPKWGLISQKPPAFADGVIGWNEVAGIPGALADGQIAWGEVQSTPAGFADGVDDVGYSSATQPTTYGVAGNDMVWVIAQTPVGTDVELTIIPAPGRALQVQSEWYERGPSADVPGGMLGHWYAVRNGQAAATTFKVRTRVYNTGIAPAALKKMAKKVKVVISKKRPG